MEAGNENMNPKFSLPVHQPDPDLWNRIGSEMDYQAMVDAHNMNVREMPVHSPAERVWLAIESRLPFIPLYRRSYFRVGLVMLAILLVSFLGWIISQMIIDITPETQAPSGNTSVPDVNGPDKTASWNLPESEKSTAMPVIKEEDLLAADALAAETGSSMNPAPAQEELVAAYETPEPQRTPELFPLAQEKPASPTGRPTDVLEMASYRFDQTASSALPADEDDYFMPKRKKGHYSLGAHTMPEYMMFTQGAPDESALSSSYGLSFKYNWSTLFVETGIGYRQFNANSLYGINFSDLNLLGSVLVVTDFQIVQYYNDEGELVIEKIYKPRFVEVYDTSSMVVEEKTEQRYSFIDIPVYFGKVVWSKNRYALAVKGGTRINIPLKNPTSAPVPASQDADIVTVEPIAVLASKTFIQFNLAMENRIYFTDRGYFSVDPMIGYHQQSVEYVNEIKKQSSWSAGLRVGIHYQLK